MVQLLRLGNFRFTVPTVSYDSFTKKISAAWKRQDKLRSPNSMHWGGLEEISATLQGVIYTELDLAKGVIGAASLNNLIKMMRVGKSYQLVTGMGTNLGRWVIHDLEVTETVHHSNGIPRKQAFNLTIEQDQLSTANLKDTFIDKAGDLITIDVGE